LSFIYCCGEDHDRTFIDNPTKYNSIRQPKDALRGKSETLLGFLLATATGVTGRRPLAWNYDYPRYVLAGYVPVPWYTCKFINEILPHQISHKQRDQSTRGTHRTFGLTPYGSKGVPACC
jgi:hypothetical protein